MKKTDSVADGGEIGGAKGALFTRREILKGAVVAGGATLITHPSVFGGYAFGARLHPDGDAKTEIDGLNRVLLQEYIAVQTYQLAEESGLIKDGLYDGVNMYRYQHADEHVEALKNAIGDLGGSPVAAPPKTKSNGLTIGGDLGSLLHQLLEVEVQLGDMYAQIIQATGSAKFRAALEENKLDEMLHQRLYRYVLSQK